MRLVDVEAPLTLFVEGMAGRYLHIKATDEFTGRATFNHSAGQTSDTLYLPTQLEHSAEAGAFRVLAMQQVGQREFGTYEFRLEIALAQLPWRANGAMASAVAEQRQSDYQHWYQLYEQPGLIAELFWLFETARIDQRMLHQYPGMVRHYRQFYRNQPASWASESVFAAAAQVAQFSLAGLAPKPAPSLWQSEVWLCLNESLQDFLQPGASLETPLDVYASATTADNCYEKLMQLQSTELLSQPKSAAVDEQDWTQREVRLQDWEDELAELNQQLMAAQVLEEAEIDALDGQADDGQTKPDNVNIQKLVAERDNLQRRTSMEQSAITHALGPAHPNSRSFLYNEWDYQQRRYHRAYCRLYEERLDDDQDTSSRDDVQTALRTIRAWQDDVANQLAQIKPLGYQRQTKVADGDELDFNAVLQARIDLRTGCSPDDRIYSRRERVRRDLGAAFLVDLSASTDDPLEPPPLLEYDLDEDDYADLHPEPSAPPARRIIDVQRDAMLVMAGALQSLGDDHGIYGFSGYGRDCVEFYVAKELGEVFSNNTLANICAMKPKRSTRMGPAIRHTTAKLLKAGYTQNLMLLLSDGFPQDCDYGPDRGEHEYGLQDTAKALAEAQAKGIEPFCITVDRSGHDYLKRMCPSANYLVLEDIEELPSALTKVYQQMAGR